MQYTRAQYTRQALHGSRTTAARSGYRAREKEQRFYCSK
nr:MAG TPA: hypothetical protein [Caudoviricetes sp.]